MATPQQLDPSGPPPGVTLDAQPSSGPPPGVTLDTSPVDTHHWYDAATNELKELNTGTPAPAAQPSTLSTLHQMMEVVNPNYAEATGAAKETAGTLGGIIKIINDHSSGVIPVGAREHMINAAAWLKQQSELKGWDTPEGVYEHGGAIGADYYGFEGLEGLIGKAVTVAGKGLSVVQRAKQIASVGEALDKIPPVIKQAAAIGLRAIHEVTPAARTAATGFGQTYAQTGGDTKEAAGAGMLAGIFHLGAGHWLGPLGDYISGLKREAAEVLEGAKPLPPPVYTPAEAKPTPATPAAPAAERFAAQEKQAAQGVTGESLDDLNQYRTVDERGTPTNIQQLGLPSRSATEPYQFRVPGWSATSETGDLLHEAGARYQQTGNRTVEGKGKANMQPWEMQQNPPFDLPRYGEEPGAVVRQVDEEGNQVPLEPPEAPTREPAEPPSSPFSHREPIMQATAYKTDVRPGSEIRRPSTIGGPSILTTDPEVAARHLTQIENIVQDPNFSKLPPQRQVDILQSHNEVMRQMQEYKNLQPQHEYSPYLHQPTFAPLAVDSALSRVGDMGDAADEMMRGPKEMYNHWENLTKDRPGGSFRQLNDEMNDLIGKTGQASRQRLAEVTQEMGKMFNGSDPHLGRAGTPTDLAIARNQFSNGYLVKRADNAFTNAWTGANRTGTFDVRKLQSEWKALVNDVGAPRMSNTFGPDRFESMNNIINDLAGEPAAAAEQHEGAVQEWQQREGQRQQLNKARQSEYDQKTAAQKATAKQKWYYDLARNGWHHLATGAGMEAVANLMPRGVLGMVTHKVGAALILKQIITHPLLAKLAYGAAQVGTKPAIYAPVIADVIHHMNATPPQPEPQEPQ